MADSFERRLPVYLLLDCSESMVGEGIEAVEKGVAHIVHEMRSDPHALETVWASVITFADTANQVVPLTEAHSFAAPRLRVRPGTALGGALSLLHDRVRQEVRSHSGAQKGDWRPMVFLLSDGLPTDDWEDAARRVRALGVSVVAIGCGPDVDTQILRQITDAVLLLKSYSPGDYKKLFQWISSSISVSSQRIGSHGDFDLKLVDLPKGVLEKANGSGMPSVPRGSLQREIFLAVRCSRFKRPYLIRYRLAAGAEAYDPIRTHVVDEDYFGGKPASESVSAVSSDKLRGVLPCPHCENDGCGVCQCGTMFCMSESDRTPTCPGCGARLTLTEGRFDVSGRHG